MFPMLCCDLYEDINMAALYPYIYIYIYIYIYNISFLAFSWGRNPYVGCDAFLGVSIFLPYWTSRLSCGGTAYIIVEKTK